MNVESKANVQSLIAMLKHERPGCRCLAASRLCMHCRQTPTEALVPSIVAAVVELLGDGEPRVREMVCYAMHRLGNAVLPVLPQLLSALATDPVPAVREAAARSLGTLAAEGVTLDLCGLRKALSDSEENVREAAQWALDKQPSLTS